MPLHLGGINPAYFFLQLKKVAMLIRALRQASMPSLPSSACLMMNAFCTSVNFDAFTRFRSSPSQDFLSENSKLERGRFRGHITPTLVNIIF